MIVTEELKLTNTLVAALKITSHTQSPGKDCYEVNPALVLEVRKHMGLHFLS